MCDPNTWNLEDLSHAFLLPRIRMQRMLVDKEPAIFDLFAVQTHAKVKVETCFHELSVDNPLGPPFAIQALPCAVGRAHWGTNQNDRLLFADQPPCTFSLCRDVEIPRLAIRWVYDGEI